MPYQHGALGEIDNSKVASAIQASTVVVYVGTAPINLIRGYKDAGLINNPIKVSNMPDVQNRIGYSKNWETFTLCEAFAGHFDNTVGNIGPIYIINVLDPDVHKKLDELQAPAVTTINAQFSAGRTEIKTDTAILDTLAIGDKVEGTDYAVSYNFAKGAIVITSLKADAPLTGAIDVSFEEVDASKIEAADIIGSAGDGVYTGLKAIALLYQNENAVTNVIAAPSWSQIPEVYSAMVSAAQKINGHWDAFVNADIPLDDAGTAVDTITKALAWKETKGYVSEFSKVYWPMVKDGQGRLFHLSTVGTVTMLRTDNSNGDIPFESPSNKQIMATGQYFGPASTNRGFDQQTGNTLNEKGITTAVYWGGQWVLWGPHTAGFEYGGNMDARAIFDVNIRMLMHITNSFQLDNGTRIDSPMSVSEKDTILNNEQEKLDTLVGRGALIGNPVVEFLEIENPISNLMNGDFIWNISATPTPPFKSGKARVTYTDEGFAAYFGGE